MIFGNKKYVLGLILFVFLISLIPDVIAEEEEDEEGEGLLLSRFSLEDLKLVTESESGQWKDSFENEIDSLWDHEIEIKSLNNGKDIFFLISWEDDTKSVEKNPDGLSLILETKKIEKPMIFKEVEKEDKEKYESQDMAETEVTTNEESWIWQADGTVSKEIFANAEWSNNKWNVVVEKKLIVDEIGEIKMGVKTEAFLKVAVWDGEKTQSFDSLEKGDIPEVELVVLPEINSHPKDIYVWSIILTVGMGSFLIAEVKKHQKVKDD